MAAKKYNTLHGKPTMSDEKFAEMIDSRKKYHSARKYKQPKRGDDDLTPQVAAALEREERVLELRKSTEHLEHESKSLAANTAALAEKKKSGTWSFRRNNKDPDPAVVETPAPTLGASCEALAKTTGAKQKGTSPSSKSSEKAPLLQDDSSSPSSSGGCCESCTIL